jgi:hypothetical protein
VRDVNSKPWQRRRRRCTGSSKCSHTRRSTVITLRDARCDDSRPDWPPLARQQPSFSLPGLHVHGTIFGAAASVGGDRPAAAQTGTSKQHYSTTCSTTDRASTFSRDRTLRILTRERTQLRAPMATYLLGRRRFLPAPPPHERRGATQEGCDALRSSIAIDGDHVVRAPWRGPLYSYRDWRTWFERSLPSLEACMVALYNIAMVSIRSSF